MSDYRGELGLTSIRFRRSQVSVAPLYPGAPSHGTRVEEAVGLPFRSSGLPRNLLGARSHPLGGCLRVTGGHSNFLCGGRISAIKLHGCTL